MSKIDTQSNEDGLSNVVTDAIHKSIVTSKDKCPHWCYKNIWEHDNTRVNCELENNHEDELTTTHFSLTHDLAWNGGVSSHLWFKEKTHA